MTFQRSLWLDETAPSNSSRPSSQNINYLAEVCRSFYPARPSSVFATYWYFAAERQAVFYRRLLGYSSPWTSDTILRQHKFTNAYRASDRVSQYLIRNVIYNGEQSEEEITFRILLFKFFNKIETWELLSREFGSISFANYKFDAYDKVLTDTIERGDRLFSAAYIMPSGGGSFGYQRKHRNFLKLLENMMTKDLPKRITECQTMNEVYTLLRSFPLLGEFLAYQYTIDINYSALTGFSEDDFVVAGPGAQNGIRKCFEHTGGMDDVTIIRMMTERQEEEFSRLGIEFRNLWGRRLHMIDCQNLFCEVDKYSRVAHPEVRGKTERCRIKQKFRPTVAPIEYWYPPKWKLNQNIVGMPNTTQMCIER